MHFFKYRLGFLFYLAFIIAGSNVSAFDDPALVYEKNQQHFDAANRFALYSYSLRYLKLSRCRNKVNLTDHTNEDLTFIRGTLSKDENIYFSEDIVAIEESWPDDIESEIAHRIKKSGNIDYTCHELESLYTASYKKAKEAFLQLIKAKIKL